MFAGGHQQSACPLAITWVSYHALALFDGLLPVQTVKDRMGDVAPNKPLDRKQEFEGEPIQGSQAAP